MPFKRKILLTYRRFDPPKWQYEKIEVPKEDQAPEPVSFLRLYFAHADFGC